MIIFVFLLILHVIRSDFPGLCVNVIGILCSTI